MLKSIFHTLISTLRANWIKGSVGYLLRWLSAERKWILVIMGFLSVPYLSLSDILSLPPSLPPSVCWGPVLREFQTPYLLCDCNLLWLLRWMKDTSVQVKDTRCSYPRSLQGQLITAISPELLTCGMDAHTHTHTDRHLFCCFCTYHLSTCCFVQASPDQIVHTRTPTHRLARTHSHTLTRCSRAGHIV